jgi:hypothetical protein
MDKTNVDILILWISQNLIFTQHWYQLVFSDYLILDQNPTKGQTKYVSGGDQNL